MLRLLFICILCVSTITAVSAQKLAHANFGNLLNEFPETAQADETLAAMADKMTKEGEAMVAKLQADLAAAEAQVQDLPPVELRKLETKLKQDEPAIRKFEQKMSVDIETKRRELLGPIIDKVKAAVEKVAKEQGYEIVIDSSTFNAVLYAEDSVDLTPAVMKELGVQ